MSDVPLSLYHVATRNDLTKMFNGVLDKIAKETYHVLTMRTGLAFVRANAFISGVSPLHWPANGFLQAALQGVFNASLAFHSLFVFSNHC
jgi:hypothetical protein